MATENESHLLDLVELRIHGVSGTPKTAMLEYADTIMVAGDDTAGFHRRRSWHAYGPAEAGGRVGRVRRHLEAYSWGGLTSGRASRAAWLVLLPFALVNVASWAIPAAAGAPGDADRPSSAAPWRGGRRRALLASIRLLALSMTVGFIVAIAGVGMDLVGWQCGGSQACSAGRRNWLRGWMPWLGERAPAVRIVFGALLPLATLAVLWALGRRSYQRYEAANPVLPADTGPYIAGQQTPFALRGLWQQKVSISRLRALHVAAPVATVAALIAYAGVQRSDGVSVDLVALVIALLLVLASFVAVLLPKLTDLGRELDSHLSAGHFTAGSRVPDLIRNASFAALLFAVVAAVIGAEEVPSRATLPGYGAALWGIALVQFGALLLITVLTGLARTGQPQNPKPFLRGWSTPVFAAVGLAVGTLFTNGLLFKAADLLATPPGQTTAGTVSYVFTLHALYLWTAWIVGIGAILAAVGTAGFLLFIAGRRLLGLQLTPNRAQAYPGLDASVRSDYLLPTGADARVREVTRARYDAELVERAPTALAVTALAGALVGVLATVLTLAGGRPSEQFLARQLFAARWLRSLGLDQLSATNGAVVGFGNVVIGLLMLALVGIGIRAYRSDTLRRSVGTLWDLGTFWPRSAHPLAPPCYCERTVPQLSTRLSGLIAQGQPVLLSAHSQGTIIAAAALFQCDAETVDHVALLTHGSPLRRLYARAFPAYFCDGTFEMLRSRLTQGDSVRWRNCWRKTDYLGRWIFTEPPVTDARYVSAATVDILVEDPPAHPRPHEPMPHDSLHAPSGDVDAPPPLRHSDYYRSHEYDACVINLEAMLLADADTTISLADYYPLADGAPPPTLEQVGSSPPW